MSGEYCPYVAYAPCTYVGFEVWDVLENHAQFKFAQDGTVTSFDTVQILEIAKELGYDTKAMSHLFPYAQQGLQSAIMKISKKE